MYIRYIYSLWVKESCFYVGVAADVIQRVEHHMKYGPVCKIFKGPQGGDVSIKILEKVISKKPDRSLLQEKRWIKKLSYRGHPLINIHGLHLKHSMISEDFLLQALKKLKYKKVLSAGQVKQIKEEIFINHSYLY